MISQLKPLDPSIQCFTHIVELIKMSTKHTFRIIEALPSHISFSQTRFLSSLNFPPKFSIIPFNWIHTWRTEMRMFRTIRNSQLQIDFIVCCLNARTCYTVYLYQSVCVQADCYRAHKSDFLDLRLEYNFLELEWNTWFDEIGKHNNGVRRHSKGVITDYGEGPSPCAGHTLLPLMKKDLSAHCLRFSVLKRGDLETPKPYTVFHVKLCHHPFTIVHHAVRGTAQLCL